jgi:metal-responsive CopG/Arc/MetJ family transcriptional regulator
MKPIQILMDEELVAALDRTARLSRSNRSQLIREAVQRHLAFLKRQRLEQQHRQGYERQPQNVEELAEWEAVQVWPED